MSKLVLFLPDGTTLDVPLARERTTIGRRANNDVCLPNLAVSGEHAVVVTILDDSFLEDLNSTNGTLVNGNAIAKHFLRDRDQIDIGRHRLVYCADNEAKPDSVVAEGMTRVTLRDFGERVESARPFVRGEQAAPASSPPADESTPIDSMSSVIAPDAAPTRESPPPQPKALATAAPPPLSAPAMPAIKLLSGVSAGTVVALTKVETTLGRPGVQVASIVRAGTAFWLKPLEGAAPPKVNRKPVDHDGRELIHGDVIEIADNRVEFVHPQGDATQDVAA
jgi:pSer/pThr/pTyr-binding forkhead associated (FHA) protein